MGFYGMPALSMVFRTKEFKKVVFINNYYIRTYILYYSVQWIVVNGKPSRSVSPLCAVQGSDSPLWTTIGATEIVHTTDVVGLLFDFGVERRIHNIITLFEAVRCVMIWSSEVNNEYYSFVSAPRWIYYNTCVPRVQKYKNDIRNHNGAGGFRRSRCSNVRNIYYKHVKSVFFFVGYIKQEYTSALLQYSPWSSGKVRFIFLTFRVSYFHNPPL
jgi:hypothetical protein